MKKEKYGIYNLKIAILAVCQLQMIIRQLIADGKKGIISNIIQIAKVVISNWKTYRQFDYKLIDDEFKDLDPQEVAELCIYISEQLQVANNKKLKDFIVAALDFIKKSFAIFKS